jgi:hypothetical protein
MITNVQMAKAINVNITTMMSVSTLRWRSHGCRFGYKIFPMKSMIGISRAYLIGAIAA